jgi:hypothetical protein
MTDPAIRLNWLEAGFAVLQHAVFAFSLNFPHGKSQTTLIISTGCRGLLAGRGAAPIFGEAGISARLLRLDFGELCRRARLANVTGITARDQFLCQYLWLDVVRAMASIARMNIDRSLEACWPWHGPRF